MKKVVICWQIYERWPSAYLQDGKWVDWTKATVKGAPCINVKERHMHESDVLVRAMEQRLDLHLAARIPANKHRHWTVCSVRDNLAQMATAMVPTGHTCPPLVSHDISDRMPDLPIERAELIDLEGSYVYFDTRKKEWVRSGKTRRTC